MGKILILTVLLCTLAPPAQSGKITIDTCRPEAVYGLGETVVFGITAAGLSSPPAYNLHMEGKIIDSGPLEGARFEAAPARAGFIRLEVHGSNESGERVSGTAAAAVAPDKIKSGLPAPEDFDDFWAARLESMRENPIETELRALGPDDLYYEGEIEAYEAVIKRGNLAATGFLALPAGSENESLPIYVSFNGASRIVAANRAAQNAARNPAMAFNLNFQGGENFLTEEEERNFRRQVTGYMYKNADDADLYPVKDIFLRVILALDYLKQRPEWDGLELIVAGGSFGGAQALVAAALDPDVTLCVAQAAAMCNHNGPAAGLQAGWPGLLQRWPSAESTAPYFDAANFASRIKSDTVMSVGFLDDVCPPSSIYAAFNNIPAHNKTMHHVVRGGHGSSPDGRSVYSYGSGEINARINRNYAEILRRLEEDIHVSRRKGPIKIDGSLCERDWLDCVETTGFYERNSGLAPVQTSVRLLYDEEYIYFGIEMEEPLTERLVMNSSKRDEKNIFSDDTVEIFVDPGGDGSRYIHLAINPAGVFRDSERLIGMATAGNAAYDTDALVAARTGDGKWIVEARISAKSLGGKILEGGRWKMDVGRVRRVRGVPEVSSWSAGSFHDQSFFRAIHFEP